MPIEIINGYPCGICGGVDIKDKSERTFYWVETNHLLREDKYPISAGIAIVSLSKSYTILKKNIRKKIVAHHAN